MKEAAKFVSLDTCFSNYGLISLITSRITMVRIKDGNSEHVKQVSRKKFKIVTNKCLEQIKFQRSLHAQI